MRANCYSLRYIKILYFDTSAIIKYFIREKGSSLIKWIVNNRIQYSLSLDTSQIALYEFKDRLKGKAKIGEISNEQLKRIISKSKHFFPNVFRIGDFRPIPGFRSLKDTNYLELCKKHGLRIEKEGRDARHLSYVINYLRCFGGISKPRIITADVNFGKIIKAESFDVINPEKVTIDEFISIINN